MIVIHAPDRPEGRQELAVFLRSLANEAGLLAMVLDPNPHLRGQNTPDQATSGTNGNDCPSEGDAG